jgi:hypothetical protein
MGAESRSHTEDRAAHLTFAVVSKSSDIKANENSHTKTTDIQN